MKQIIIEVEDNRTAKIGDYFLVNEDVLLLATTAHTTGGTYNQSVSLIDVKTGRHWFNPIKIKNVYKITAEELRRITGGEVFITKCKVTFK